MAITMTASEARAALPAILDRVEAGEEVTITRHGRPVALVVSTERRYHGRAADLFADAERLRLRIEEAGKHPISELKQLTKEQADDLVARIRADRDAE